MSLFTETLLVAAVAVAARALATRRAHADINVGVTVSATGPAASLGIPEKNTIALMPQTIGGQKVNYIVLDDASDTTNGGRQHAQADHREQGRRRARLDDDAELAGDDRRRRRVADADDLDGRVGARSSSPVDAKRRWVFKTPQNDIMMSLAIADPHGGRRRQDGRLHRLLRRLRRGLVPASSRRSRAVKGLTIVANERYARTDTSVTGPGAEARRRQARCGAGRRLRARRPCCRSARSRNAATPASTTRRTASPTTTSCASAARTSTARYLPSGPVLVAAQLPATNPVRAERARVRHQVRGGVRQGLGLDLRRPRLGRRPADGRSPRRRR